MYKLILFFILGIVVGIFLKKQTKLLRICYKLTEISVLILLFILGFLMGSNTSIMKNLLTLGIDSAIITFFSIIGSIIFILPLEKKIK